MLRRARARGGEATQAERTTHNGSLLFLKQAKLFFLGKKSKRPALMTMPPMVTPAHMPMATARGLFFFGGGAPLLGAMTKGRRNPPRD